MLTRTLVVVGLLGSGLARADAAKAAKLLREGQKLEAKDAKGAEAKLKLALAESPNDPKILAELGYAALLAKDYATAETMTRKAIALATDDKLKAAASYNLGDILAAKGDKAGADAAHAEAKRLREAAVAMFAPHPLEGPYASIEKFCAKWTARKDADRDQNKVTDGCRTDEDATATLDGHAVRAIVGGWSTEEKIHHTWHFVAIQLAAGWYVGDVDDINSAGGTGEGNMALELGDLKVVDLAVGVHALVIPDHMSVTDTEERSYEIETTSDEMVVCGIGKSGKPSCTGTLIVGGHHAVLDHGSSSEVKDWALVPSFPGKGVLQLTLDKTKKMSAPTTDDNAPPAGAHPLVFP